MAKDGDAFAAASERAERARALVDAGAFLATDGAVLVYSDRPGVAGYTVEVGRGCSCPDATLGQAARVLQGRCKHRLAAELVWAELRRAARERLAAIEEEMSA